MSNITVQQFTIMIPNSWIHNIESFYAGLGNDIPHYCSYKYKVNPYTEFTFCVHKDFDVKEYCEKRNVKLTTSGLFSAEADKFNSNNQIYVAFLKQPYYLGTYCPNLN